MRLLYYFLALLIVSPIYARDYNPDEITNPNLKDRRVYVSDPANLVSERAEATTNAILWNLRQKTGAEVGLVVVPNTGNYTREEFATKVFENWGLGKKDKDNGALILIVPDQKEAWIATGYGLEGIIPDISASRILQKTVVPHMRENDLDGAVTSVATEVSGIISDPQAAEEIRSNRGEAWEEMPESDITSEDFMVFIICVVVGLFIIGMAKYFTDNYSVKNKDRYEQARKWHDNRTSYLLLGIFSLGLGMIPYWLSRRKYNKARNAPMKCETCGSKMKKLNEEEDNNLLSPSQDFEEQINSVDYDVWVCPECGTVERYAFPNRHSPYEECGHCHTKAMTLVKDHTVVAPTVRHSGVGERVYECKYCHNQTKKRYVIPKREDGKAAALAAGAILGSARGGGGGFGGGFGGGHTGGGGGGARW